MANPKPQAGRVLLAPTSAAGRYWSLPPASTAGWFAAGGAVLVAVGALLGVGWLGLCGAALVWVVGSRPPPLEPRPEGL
jgi:hypothetical protein